MAMHELFDPLKKIGIKWCLNKNLGSDFGSVSFYFDGVWYPKEPLDNYNLHTIFSNLKNSITEPYYSSGTVGQDFGEKEFDIELLNNLELPNLISIETTELTGMVSDNCSYGCLVIYIGFSGKTERIFYSFDLGITYKELRLAKGTFEGLIYQLPVLK